MSDEEKPASVGGGILGTAASVTNAYKEEFKPAAREIGKLAEATGRAVNLAISPVLGLVWCGEQVREWVETKVAAKMAATPADAIVPPKGSIVAPALEHVRFRVDEPDIQALFANLIASAMDRRLKQRIFPNFVEILKQLTPDEAKILSVMRPDTIVPMVSLMENVAARDNIPEGMRIVESNLSLIGFTAGCEEPDLTQSYIDNLARLGLIQFLPPDKYLVTPGSYDALESHKEFVSMKDELTNTARGGSGLFQRSGFFLTTLGKDFVNACIRPYEVRSKQASDKGDSSSN